MSESKNKNYIPLQCFWALVLKSLFGHILQFIRPAQVALCTSTMAYHSGYLTGARVQFEF